MLKHQGIELPIFSLPSPGVPVLTGMRELMKLDALLGCKGGKCLINGFQRELKVTKKRHLLIDYVQDIFKPPMMQQGGNSSGSAPTSAMNARPKQATDRIWVDNSGHSRTNRLTQFSNNTNFAEVHDLWMFDMRGVDLGEAEHSLDFQHSFVSFSDVHGTDLHSMADHFGISEKDAAFLIGDSATSTQDHKTAKAKSVSFEQNHDRRHESRNEKDDERGDAGAIDRDAADRGIFRAACSSQEEGSIQSGSKDSLRRDSCNGARLEGSQDVQRMLAVQRSTRRSLGQQPLWKVAGVSEVRSEVELCTGQGRTSTDHTGQLGAECPGGTSSPSHGWPRGERFDCQEGQSNDHDCGKGEDCGEERHEGQRLQAISKEGALEGGSGGCGLRGRECSHGGAGGEEEKPPTGGIGSSKDGHHDTLHYEGHEAHGRETSVVERDQLRKAASEFKKAAIIAALQDCDTASKTIWEVCCRLDSSLTMSCQKRGMKALRKTLENGYDIFKEETVTRLKKELRSERPKRGWFSLKCTEWTNIQNINQRTDQQIELLRKRRGKARKAVRNALSVIEEGVTLDSSFRFYWEWPKSAYAGWNLEEMQRFVVSMQRRGIRLYWTEIHGCMFDVQSPDGEKLNKAWWVMTNDQEFNDRCTTLCDGSHSHRAGGIIGIGSQAVAATAYYPSRMVDMISDQWNKQDKKEKSKHWTEDIVKELYAMDDDVPMDASPSGHETMQPEDEEKVTLEQRARAKALLHKLHRAAGHPSNRALVRLCKEKGMPKWMQKLAAELECQACVDTARGEQKVLPVSLGAKPSPWQVVAADTMELVFPSHGCKARFLVMTDVVMKFTSIRLVWKGPVGEAGIDSGRKLAEAFVEGWLLHRPRPMWVTVDPQTSLGAGDFVEFLQLAGIGVSVAPGEAHWQSGTIESMNRVIKNVMRRLRNQHPELSPEVCAGLAVNSHNNMCKVKGFTPIQWAFGVPSNWDDSAATPLDANAHTQHIPYKFWMTHRFRADAERVWQQCQANEAWTKLKHAAPRDVRIFHVGEWVCVWRTAIWRSRKTKSFNPEPRFVGPGRVAMVEPAIIAENKPAVYWVLMGTQVWRCAPEQLRRATQQEVTLEELSSRSISTPVTELLKKTSRVIDTTKEPTYAHDEPDLPEHPLEEGEGQQIDPYGGNAQPPQHWQEDMEEMRDRRTSRKRKEKPVSVKMEQWRWKQLVSLNENRKREGLPAVMELPPIPTSTDEELDFAGKTSGAEVFDLASDGEQMITEESYHMIRAKIGELEHKLHQQRELEQLRSQSKMEREREQLLFSDFEQACKKEEEVCEMILNIEDHEEFLRSGFVYVKQLMSSTKEINFRTLTDQHRSLVQEAMARELSEVMSSQALKRVKEFVPADVLQQRNLPMRWLLTWKTLDEWTDPSKEQPGVIREDGWAKAKARIVLIGYKHPDLAKRDGRTGRPLLQTASPTLSRMGRNLLLQAGALNKHLLEAADAKSAFLQAEQGIGLQKKLYTTAVDEISQAMGVPYGTALEIIGAIYGLTNAPRIFWLDADEKLTRLGGEVHGIDKCMWVFYNQKGDVCGRVGAHVDDFLIMGDHGDSDWIRIRKSISQMYSWSPWKKGQFVFAGVHIHQHQDFSVFLSQENFCNDLRPITIDNERQRPKDDQLTSREISQCRGLIMKAQWRAIQTAPQYCCRIGLASSALTKPTLATMKEANAIVKELRKTSKDGLLLHSFAGEDLKWNTVIFVHFGDAARNNRIDGSDTGGYITGVASPIILTGKEARMSVVDYRSWKLDRPARGSNGSEAQALYETEDKGWKARLFWALLHGKRLLRGNADELAACVESLLVTDSRGCYDALSNNDSPLLGMSNAKTGVELRSVQNGTREGSQCYITWVPSDLNLSDCVTKVSYEAFRVWALFNSRKSWIVKFNDEFISARKQQKLRQQQGKPIHPLMDINQPPEFEADDGLSWPTR